MVGGFNEEAIPSSDKETFKERVKLSDEWGNESFVVDRNAPDSIHFSRAVGMLVQFNEELVEGGQSGILQKYRLMMFKGTLDKQLAPRVIETDLTHCTADGERSNGFAERGDDVSIERLQLKVKRFIDKVFRV